MPIAKSVIFFQVLTALSFFFYITHFRLCLHTCTNYPKPASYCLLVLWYGSLSIVWCQWIIVSNFNMRLIKAASFVLEVCLHGVYLAIIIAKYLWQSLRWYYLLVCKLRFNSIHWSMCTYPLVLSSLLNIHKSSYNC